MAQTFQILLPNTSKNLTTTLSKDGQDHENFIIFLGRNSDQFTLSTTTIHQALHTSANTVVRGVLFDKSSAQIDGMIKINHGAQFTNSFLEQKIILVGDQARANAQPMLEIEANEVKASHAATVGQVDQIQLFYLQSRGFSAQMAINTIVFGFFQPIIDKIHDKAQKAEIKKMLKYNMGQEILLNE